jgi:acyl-coenzyme A thioesterase PaaI-like protein
MRVGGRRVMLEPHNCFACGTLNTHGLQLVLHADGGTCWTEPTLDRRFEGWEDIAHGGIVTTILDEVMAWALVERDLWGVTARIDVEFRKPVPIGRPIRGEGRVTGSRRRVVETEGRILDPVDGTLLARAEGRFVVAPEARRQELKERYGFRLVPDADVPVDPGAVPEDAPAVDTPGLVDQPR